MTVGARVRAPELLGRGWLNTSQPLSLDELRGRFVLLDFWTFCCINCLHVLDELRPLEAKYAEELVVVGVHSPKFDHEADPVALRAALQRYGVHHPVLDDPDLLTWRAYVARAWPTLVLVDPEGYVVAQYAGEGHRHAIDALIGQLVEQHRARGTLQPGGSPYVAPEVDPGELRFPAKAIRLPNGNVLVADTGHHQIVELADGEVVRRVGTGEPGLRDGTTDETRFREPNGLCLLPDGGVVVADTGNHALRRIAPAGTVTTLAGDGTAWMPGDGTDHLSSPWDVAWWRGRVWVAMAGIHQLWTVDPASGRVEVAAGTTNEGLLDGPVDQAWFAQTSGLGVDGDRLWLADSETSSLRVIEADRVETRIGSGLFDFGFVDGGRAEARMQHPLGVTVLPDGSVAVCDTYNGAVRRYVPDTEELSTLATGLAEPSGALVDGEWLVVVESAAHRLVRIPLGASAPAPGVAHETQRPVTQIAGTVELVVTFEPPPGQKVDDRFGPATQLVVTATPPTLVKKGDGRGAELARRIVFDPVVGSGVLHVAARAASCDVEGEGAACHLHQQDWGVPIRVVEEGVGRLTLPLSERS